MSENGFKNNVISRLVGRIVRKYIFKTYGKFAQKDKLLLADSGPEKFVVHVSDQIISKRLYSRGEFDFNKFELALKLIGDSIKIDTLIDIGAHIGPICIPAIKRGLVDKAIAIEPEPRNFELLMANIWLNGLADCIESHNLALGPNDNEFLNFSLSPTNYGDHRVTVSSQCGAIEPRNAERQIIHVPSCRLDTLLGDADVSNTLIWMDTQGFEGHILSGAGRLMQRCVPLVIEFWPGGMDMSGSFEPLLEAVVGKYSYFYDLRYRSPQRHELNRETLTAYYTKIKKQDDERDILII